MDLAKTTKLNLDRLHDGNCQVHPDAGGCLFGPEMVSTGRGMSSPRAEDAGKASLICPARLNSQHVPQGGLIAAKSCPRPRYLAGLLGSGDFPAPRNRMVDSPPLHVTQDANLGRSLGLSRNATGLGLDTPQVQYPQPGNGYAVRLRTGPYPLALHSSKDSRQPAPTRSTPSRQQIGSDLSRYAAIFLRARPLGSEWARKRLRSGNGKKHQHSHDTNTLLN